MSVHDLLSAMLFAFLCFLLVLLFRMVPSQSAEVLCSVSKHKKAVNVPHGENTVLDKLCSGLRYGAVGHEFDVNE